MGLVDSPPAHEAIETGAVFGVVDAYEGNVLNFVRNVLARIAGNSGFELAGKVMELLAR